jgi:hypothetical protein
VLFDGYEPLAGDRAPDLNYRLARVLISERF